jgi:hypothetical protein
VLVVYLLDPFLCVSYVLVGSRTLCLLCINWVHSFVLVVYLLDPFLCVSCVLVGSRTLCLLCIN